MNCVPAIESNVTSLAMIASVYTVAVNVKKWTIKARITHLEGNVIAVPKSWAESDFTISSKKKNSHQYLRGERELVSS